MSRANGVHYWDVHGKRYLDGISGIYVVSVGHSNPRVTDAIRRQMEVLHFSPTMHGSNTLAVELANRLVAVAPGDLEAVWYAVFSNRMYNIPNPVAPEWYYAAPETWAYRSE